MRVLAGMTGDGPRGARMAPAVVGLALRGHAVYWTGSPPPGSAPPTLRRLERRRDLWEVRAQIVVSDAAGPVRPALAGWQSGASCLVMALEHGAARRWRFPDHWTWHSLHAWGLIEPAEATAFREDPLRLDLERMGLWSDEAPRGEPDPASLDTEILERACERALARHRSRAPRPAAFLDRDGTLVREVGYLADPADLELLPGVPSALRALQAAGYVLVVVSNQSGVGRGLFGLSNVHEAMARLRGALRGHGVEIDGIYFCSHHPDSGCPCRKPRPGLLVRAAEDLHLSLRDSVMVGDKVLDVETAHQAGAVGILVRTGYGRDEEQRLDGAGVMPEAVCDDLAQAAARILIRSPGP